MAGYNGYSMSNNAVEAYQAGEKPLSKWTKANILTAVQQSADNGEFTAHFDLKNLKKLSVKTLRQTVLYASSWHHTSDHYNQTDFYSVDADKLNKITNATIADYLADDKKPAAAPVARKARVKYVTWEGQYRNFKRPVEHEAVGEIRGNWCYFEDGTKKSINGNGFAILEEE